MARRRLAAKAERAAALAAAAAPPPAAPCFTATGKAFIDAFANLFMGAAPPQRRAIVNHILVTAAAHAQLGCATWTASSVYSRLLFRGRMNAAA